MELKSLDKKERCRMWFKQNTFPLILGSLIALYILSLLLPVLWGLFTSFREYRDFLEEPFGTNGELTFKNYIITINELKIKTPTATGGSRYIYIEEMLFNSLLYAFGLPICSVIPVCTIGYVMAKYKFKFNKILMFCIVAVMTMPTIGGVAGELAMLKALNIYDTFFGMCCLKFGFATTWCLIYYSAFEGVSWDYAEAVFIDGGNHFTVFFNVMLPFVKSFNITFFLLMLMSHWVDYNLSMFYMPSRPNLAYGLYYAKFTLPAIQRETVTFAASFMLALPTILLYVFLADTLMGEHMQLGGLKG